MYSYIQLLCLAECYKLLQGFIDDGYRDLFIICDSKAFYSKLVNRHGRYVFISANLLTCVVNVDLNGKKHIFNKVR